MAENFSFFQKVNRDFDKAAKFTDYPHGLLEQIKIVIVPAISRSDKAGRWNY